jgi:hypothetical protein
VDLGSSGQIGAIPGINRYDCIIISRDIQINQSTKDARSNRGKLSIYKRCQHSDRGSRPDNFYIVDFTSVCIFNEDIQFRAGFSDNQRGFQIQFTLVHVLGFGFCSILLLFRRYLRFSYSTVRRDWTSRWTTFSQAVQAILTLYESDTSGQVWTSLFEITPYDTFSQAVGQPSSWTAKQLDSQAVVQPSSGTAKQFQPSCILTLFEFNYTISSLPIDVQTTILYDIMTSSSSSSILLY